MCGCTSAGIPVISPMDTQAVMIPEAVDRPRAARPQNRLRPASALVRDGGGGGGGSAAFLCFLLSCSRIMATMMVNMLMTASTTRTVLECMCSIFQKVHQVTEVRNLPASLVFHLEADIGVGRLF